MLTDQLKFLIGAVARKDFVESQCHLLIRDGVGYAYDGLLSSSTPVDIAMHVKPHARTFMKAIQACDDEGAIALNVTGTGRLGVKSGSFKAFVQCLDNESEMTIPMPEGVEVPLTEELLDSIEALAPFMSIDASRPWAMGLRLKGNSTYVTNNIILIERWHGGNFPFEIIIPSDAVKELLRIRERPVKAQVTQHSITFFFESGKWIRTQLIEGQWPDRVDEIFNQESLPKELPEGFFSALDTLKPFVDETGRVYLLEDRIATSREDGVGAAVELVIDGAEGQVFHLAQLRALSDVATKIDFQAYPRPCAFFGEKLRGVIIGLRD